MSSQSNRNRWNNADRAERLGSLTHELLVLPTFAPHLARPEYLNRQPGDPIVLLQPRSQQLRDGFQAILPAASQDGNRSASMAPDSSASATIPSDEDQLAEDEVFEQVAERTFFVSVVSHKALPPVISSNDRTLKNAPKVPDVTTSAGRFPVLSLKRKPFINDVIFSAALGGGDVYKANDNGPEIKLWYYGSGGGQKGAASIFKDSDWDNVMQELSLTKATTVNKVSVSIDITDSVLQHYKKSNAPLAVTQPLGAHISGPTAPPPFQPGTYVLTIESFSQQEQDVGNMIDAIRAANKCGNIAHGLACHIDGEKLHWPLSRFCERQFTDWVLADSGRGPTDPAPQVLLNAWAGRPVGAAARPRGRGGSIASGSEATSDFGSLFAQGMDLFAGAMTSAISSANHTGSSSTSSVLTPTAPSHSSSRQRSPSPSVDLRSSPPPAPAEEMDVCVDRYAKCRALPTETVSKVKDGLKAEGLFPEDVGSPEVSVEKITTMTGLEGGAAMGFKRFAATCAQKVEAKRTRRNLD
ncbi:hypothetical protein BDZ89DRAFT_1135096 [Hymenopellis radicata]|nr:hypothetical protein BDZ89DRAFT_1135096 [Hymenopellis radicata]